MLFDLTDNKDRLLYSKFKNKFDQIILIFFINYIFLIIYKYAKFYIFYLKHFYIFNCTFYQ